MLYHDMSNDYRNRDYRITITIQDGYFKGEIYYDYSWGGAMGHGMSFDVIEQIYDYLLNLSYNDYDDFDCAVPDKSGGFELDNNCAFRIDRDDRHLHFVLFDKDKNRLEKSILKSEIGLYIVGISMTKCTGHGVKRDNRKCVICKNFERIEGTNSGICLDKKKKVSQGTTICKYGFVERE